MDVLYENVTNLIFFCSMSLFGLLIFKKKKVKEFCAKLGIELMTSRLQV